MQCHPTTVPAVRILLPTIPTSLPAMTCGILLCDFQPVWDALRILILPPRWDWPPVPPG